MMRACACVTYVTCAWVAWAHVCLYHTCLILAGVMYIAWLICGGMCGFRFVFVCVVCVWLASPWGWLVAVADAPWLVWRSCWCMDMHMHGRRWCSQEVSSCVCFAVLEVDGLLVYMMATYT